MNMGRARFFASLRMTAQAQDDSLGAPRQQQAVHVLEYQDAERRSIHIDAWHAFADRAEDFVGDGIKQLCNLNGRDRTVV